ncbi:LOW QUALITY PROTEIN: conserved hypothetical protein, partial [Streptomyces sp. SPB074]
MAVRPRTPYLSRTRGVLLALAACLAGVVPLGSAPAAAADPPLTAPATYHVAPPGGPRRPARDKHLHVRYHEDAVAGEKTGRLITDVRGAEDVLRLRKYGNGCSGDAARIVCEVGASYDNWADWAGALPYAAPGSEAGDAGDLHLRYEAPDGKVAEATTRVVVGGPVLEIRRPEKVAHLRPGARTHFAFVVRNAGETPANGLGLTYTTDTMTPTTERFSNCSYHGATAVCRFPALDLAPGESVGLAPGLDLRPEDRNRRKPPPVRLAARPRPLRGSRRPRRGRARQGARPAPGARQGHHGHLERRGHRLDPLLRRQPLRLRGGRHPAARPGRPRAGGPDRRQEQRPRRPGAEPARGAPVHAARGRPRPQGADGGTGRGLLRAPVQARQGRRLHLPPHRPRARRHPAPRLPPPPRRGVRRRLRAPARARRQGVPGRPRPRERHGGRHALGQGAGHLRRGPRRRLVGGRGSRRRPRRRPRAVGPRTARPRTV